MAYFPSNRVETMLDTGDATLQGCSSISAIHFVKSADGTVNIRGYIQLTTDIGSGSTKEIGSFPERFIDSSMTGTRRLEFTIPNKAGGTYKSPCILILDGATKKISVANPTIGNQATLVYSSFSLSYNINNIF